METQEVKTDKQTNNTIQVLFKWESQPSLEVTAYASKGLFFLFGPAEAADAVCLMPMRTEKPRGNKTKHENYTTFSLD